MFFPQFRCKSFQATKRGELCRIPGSSVSLVTPGSPVLIRLPHVNVDVFRQFILYVYTGKVSCLVYPRSCHANELNLTIYAFRISFLILVLFTFNSKPKDRLEFFQQLVVPFGSSELWDALTLECIQTHQPISIWAVGVGSQIFIVGTTK